MRTKSTVVSFIICFFLLPMLINSCQAIEEKEYSLQIKITTSYFPPFQSVCSAVVSVELTNIGNETFNGTLIIEGKTDKHSYAPVEYPISNLNKNAVEHYSKSFRTDDEGTYWFTVKIQEEHFSTIKLYRGSILVDEGQQVEAGDSIFLYSFTHFLMILGIVATVIVGIAAIYRRKRKK